MNTSPGDAPSITPEEAARSLAVMRASQARIIRGRPWFPGWYTTGVALHVTGIQFLTEPGTSRAVTVTGVIALTAALGGLVVALAVSRRQRPHRSLVTPGILAVFTAWVLLSMAVCWVLALGLTFAEVPYARTYAALAMTAFMAATGPIVARRITGHMAARIEAGR
ncbi:hypothetical protein [Sphaerisporangium sp. TRM90804]|uniref:hypothetical protein n=1 Tax=Sphaerisporangium sp. TRM90804 TaxID=3031113 RepID=UPI00244758EE|nr:hypothetical protein [Sphaerisporangium sp. TRM90804]MDH2429829.1 hypothetical protein [Sphaerisporangium sp. TRM90804]